MKPVWESCVALPDLTTLPGASMHRATQALAWTPSSRDVHPRLVFPDHCAPSLVFASAEQVIFPQLLMQVTT